MGLRQIEQVFSLFFAKYLPHFQSVSVLKKVVRNFEESSNMAKIWQKMKKSLVPQCIQPIFRLIPGTRKTDFGYKNYFS